MNRNTANLWLGLIRVLMIVAIPTSAFAQAVESLTAGTRIRVKTAAPNEWRVGYVQSVDASTIVVTTNGLNENKATAAQAPYSWTLPLASVSRVEVSRGMGGRANRTVIGAFLGALGGGLMLGTIGYLATRCNDCEESGIGVLLGPMFGVPIGAAFGAISGFATPRERWEPVSVRGTGGSAR